MSVNERICAYLGLYGVRRVDMPVILRVKRMGVYERCVYVYVGMSVSERNSQKSKRFSTILQRFNNKTGDLLT
mgnify:CR=1 FL=1